MTNFKNILIVRTDRMGDVVLTTPVFKVLRKAYPQSRISVLVQAKNKDLLLGNPYVDELIIYDREGKHSSIIKCAPLVWELYQKKFDCAIIFHTKMRSNTLCFLAGIPCRIGYKNKKFECLLTHGIEDTKHLGLKHEVEYCLDILRAMNIPVSEERELFIPLQPKAEQWMSNWLSGRYDPEHNRLVVIHPGASSPTKCWPARSFARLINCLLERYAVKIVLIGGKENQKISKEITSQVSRPVYDLTGCTSVAQTASLLKRSDLLISNDSGPVHVAAAAGTHVISLFLRDQPGINPQRWKPLGQKSYALMNKPQEAIRLNGSGQVEQGSFDSISVHEVVDLVEQIFGKELSLFNTNCLAG